MRRQTPQKTRWDILQLGLLAVGLVIAGAVALFAYIWADLNQAEARQETLLVDRKVDRNLARLHEETVSVTAWDEAYFKTKGSIDPDWIDEKLTEYYHLSFDHDVTLLFDGRGRLQYAARDGERVALGQEEDLEASILSTVRSVQRSELKQRDLYASQGGRRAKAAAQRSIIVAPDGRVYFLAVAAILPRNGLMRDPQAASVVVTGWLLDRQLLAQLSQDIGVPDLGFRRDPSLTSGPGVVPLIDPDGRGLGALVWTPSQPGADALRKLAEPAIVAGLVMALVFTLLGMCIARMLRDLSAQEDALHETLHALTVARDDARAASVAKSEFIANISHEIRTPLNGIMGMAQVMARDALPPPQHDRVDIILQSGKGLLSILNSALDLSKIEAGRLEIMDAPFELAPLLSEVCRTYEAVAQGKGIRLDWRAGDAGGSWIGDEGRIRQILLNLVSNAVKFTDLGVVQMDAQALDGGLVVRIRDDGPGIARERLGELFNAFTQLDNSSTRRFGGTGLGLAISRRLAALMGGDISVESTEGQGSTFTLRLPLARPLAREAAREIASPEPAVSKGLRILAAEDNATNRLVLQALLAPLEAELILARDGQEAVSLFRDHMVDIVLMDIQMPIMDGLAATKAIRAIEDQEGRRKTPILAITADALQHQAESYLMAGMDGHVAKPLSVELLYAAIENALGEPSEPAVVQQRT